MNGYAIAPHNVEVLPLTSSIYTAEPEVAAMLEQAEGERFVRCFARGRRLEKNTRKAVKKELPKDLLQH